MSLSNSAKFIGEWAFAHCTELKSVAIPNSVTELGSGAFYNCTNLTSVTIGNHVQEIKTSTFEKCTNLTSVKIPDSVTALGSTFKDCSSLEYVNIGKSVKTVDCFCFSRCKSLTAINVDVDNLYFSSLDGIMYDKDFSTIIRCPLKRSLIEMPNTVTTIGRYAFEQCENLIEIEIGNSVITIDDGAFCDCRGLTAVNFGESVTTIGEWAFRRCINLTDVEIGPNVQTIGESAFEDCHALESLVIPQSVTAIGDRAFNSGKIQKIYVYSETPVECSEYADIFSNAAYEYATLYVPKGTLEAYKVVIPWKNFANIVENDNSGIEDAVANDTDFLIYVNDSIININGADPCDMIFIYNTEGSIVYMGNERMISSLSPGVYIVRIGQKTVKVTL